MAFGETIEDLVAERDAWIGEYGIAWGTDTKGKIYNHDEMSQADHAKLKKLDEKKLVWTNHSTCEDEFFTPGYYIFENSCCWQTYSFYVAEHPWEDENERIYATAYMPCPVCNADGEGDGDPDCQGPELPETKYGVDMGDGCEDGYIQVYLD